jgi:hypothetical protein
MEDIIAKLCTKNPSKRLGNMKGGIADLIKHKWFGSFDWKGLRKGTVAAPFVPDVQATRLQQAQAADADGPIDDELVVSVFRHRFCVLLFSASTNSVHQS